MGRNSLIVAAGLFAMSGTSVAAQDEPAGAQLNAEQVLLDVYAHYRSLEAYSATISIVTDLAVIGSPEMAEAMAEAATQQATIRFARPTRVYYESQQIIVASDGETLAYGMPMMMQYVEQAAPAEASDDIWSRLQQMMGVAGGGSATVLLDPLTLLIHDEADARESLSGLKGVTAERVELDGEPHIHVTATMSADRLQMMGADDVDVPIEFWIDPQRRLITRQRLDMTEAIKEMMQQMVEAQGQAMLGGVQYERMIMTTDLEDQLLNPAFDDEAFTYDWKAEGYEKADEGSPLAAMFGAQTSPLLAVEAPEIDGKTLDGESFLLSDLRGNVVVLDFWATWCGPCVQAMPKIQELHEHFASQPVRVIGINQDRGNRDTARRFVERKEITFTHVVDAANQIGQAYHVTGIPTTVIIDQQGVVQAVHVGFMPGAEKELEEQIETLLAGGALITDEDRERATARREEMRDVLALEAREDTGESKETTLEEFSPQKLVEKESFGGGGYGYAQITKLDVNGDGRDELLVPSVRANYSIIHTDGRTELLRLQGMPRQQAGTIEVVTDNGRPHFVYAASVPTMTGEMRLILGLWRTDGTRVWSSEIRHESQAALMPILAAGDVNGDGRAEIVLAISVTEYAQSGETQFARPTQMQAFLAIYDLDGNRLVQRRVGNSIQSMVLMKNVDGGADVIAHTGFKMVRFTFDADASAPPDG